MFRLKGLDHVGLTVKDLDRSVAFYEQLGLVCLRMAGPNAEGLRSAVVQVGVQELNIFSHPRVATGSVDDVAGIHHFCFEVQAESVESVVGDLQKAGIAIDRGPIQRRDAMALFLQDPDGVRVELQLKQKPTF